MPFLRRRRTATASELVRAIGDDERRSRGRRLRDLFKSPETRQRELLELKLVDSAQSSPQCIDLPPKSAITPVQTPGQHDVTSPSASREGPPEHGDGQSDDARCADDPSTSQTYPPPPNVDVNAAFAGAVCRNSDVADYRTFDCDAYWSALLPIGGDTAEGSAQTSLAADEGEHGPDMRHAHGLYAGTVGARYFRQVGQSKEPDVESAWSEEQSVLASDPESIGLREIDMQAVVDRLVELCHNTQATHRSSGSRWLSDKDNEEQRFALLGQFLASDPSQGQPESADNLSHQIKALERILASEGVWHDLSKESTRIKLGMLMFQDDNENDDQDLDQPARNHLTRHDILLLQLMLSCELLNRHEVSNARKIKTGPSAAEGYTPTSTSSIEWDLLLARLFLSRIQAFPLKRPVERQSTLEIAKRLFFPASLYTPADVRYDEKPDVLLLPRHQEQQLDGLKHFATSLGWSDMEDLQNNLVAKFPPLLLRRTSLASMRRQSVYATPLATSRSQRVSEADDYFSSRPRPIQRALSSRPSLRAQVSRGRTLQRSFQLSSATPSGTPTPDGNGQLPAATPQPQSIGWLTRTYMTGLVLPGESLQHLLVSAMLENSPQAMVSLGDTATLLGGFVYNRRSYWSRQCIVGRVLAGLRSAQEGWGWVGTNCIPNVKWSSGDHGDAGWRGEGWIEVISEDVAPPVARQSGLDDEAESGGFLKVQDYSLPQDLPAKPSSLLWFEGVRLLRDEEDVDLLDEQSAEDPLLPAACTASLGFSSATLSSEVGTPRLALKYDVYFVAATPCNPPPESLLRQLQLLPNSDNADAGLQARSAHPLHKSSRFRIVSAAAVLSNHFQHAFGARSATSPSNTSQRAPHEVLILDARGSETLELVARSWCASVGEHAVIGRESDTCIACCIRKASLTGISVILRI